jgi:hypothetical protein
MAFLLSSTNLVIEFGVILWLLMDWQFAVAEWEGGIALIALMSIIVKLTYPKKIIEVAGARQKPSQKKCCVTDEMNHDHMHMETMKESDEPGEVKIFNFQAQRKIAGNYFMEWSML